MPELWLAHIKGWLPLGTFLATFASTAILGYSGLAGLELRASSALANSIANAKHVDEMREALTAINRDCQQNAVGISAARAEIREKANNCARLEREIDQLRERAFR